MCASDPAIAEPCSLRRQLQRVEPWANYDQSAYDLYEEERYWSDYDAQSEATSWRIHELVMAWIDEEYGEIPDWAREELCELGDDALASEEQPIEYDLEGCGSGDLSCWAESTLRNVLDDKWSEQQAWLIAEERKGLFAHNHRRSYMPVYRRRSRARSSRRSAPGRRRGSRRVASRAGPSDDPGGGDEPDDLEPLRPRLAGFTSADAAGETPMSSVLQVVLGTNGIGTRVWASPSSCQTDSRGTPAVQQTKSCEQTA